MREIRTSGSEGGAGRKPRSYLYHAILSPYWIRLRRVGAMGLMGDDAFYKGIPSSLSNDSAVHDSAPIAGTDPGN